MAETTRRRSAADRMAMHDRKERTIKLAGTYVMKATGWMHWDDTRPISSSYEPLLETLIDVANDIAEALPDSFYERNYVEPNSLGLGGDGHHYRPSDRHVELAEKLVATMKERVRASEKRERIAKLENVEGRAEIEAVAFRAKAAELRAGAS